jgi:phosphonate transport system substrate-binding protein
LRSASLAALFALSALGAACARPSSSPPERLRLVVVPNLPVEELHAQHEPLQRYLQGTLGVAVELVIARDYTAAISAVGTGAADVAFLGGAAYLMARQRHGAVPVVMGDEDRGYSSSFFVRARDTAQADLNLLRGRLQFGDSLSTSGYLMPRYFLRRRGPANESTFEVVGHSATHAATIAAVLEGRADIGVVSTPMLERMIAGGLVSRSDLRVVWVTPPYPGYVWAARPGLPAEFLERLRGAFLELSPLDSAHAAVLRAQRVTGYVPVRQSEFALLERVAVDAGLLPRAASER